MEELTKALLAVQKDLPTVGKDSDNPFFKSKYASLAHIMKVVLPILNKHGVFVSQAPDQLDGQPTLVTNLVHGETGQQVSSTMPLFLTKNDPQGQGSAITYARRYAIVSMLGLVVDEDDDGNAGSTLEPTKPKQYIDPLEDLKVQARKLMAKHGFTGKTALEMTELFIGKKLPKDRADFTKLIQALKDYDATNDIDLDQEPDFGGDNE